MKFLVDVCAGRRLAEWLRPSGHDVREVRDRDPQMDDDEILTWACVENRVVVTIDKDFGALAVARGQPHGGIVRLPDVPYAMRERLMKQVLSKHEADLAKGAIVTVSLHRIRVRL